MPRDPSAQEPSNTFPFTARHASAALVLIAHGIAASVQVFLRSGYGDRALGVHHGVAAACLFFYALLWPPEHWGPVWMFLVLYIVILNIRRAGVLRRRLLRTGHGIHSRYEGRSILHRLLPRASEWWIRIYAEPALVFIVAALLVGAIPAVATYLFVAGILMGGEARAHRRRLRQHAQDMHDAMINQQIAIVEFERIRRGGR